MIKAQFPHFIPDFIKKLPRPVLPKWGAEFWFGGLWGSWQRLGALSTPALPPWPLGCVISRVAVSCFAPGPQGRLTGTGCRRRVSGCPGLPLACSQRQTRCEDRPPSGAENPQDESTPQCVSPLLPRQALSSFGHSWPGSRYGGRDKGLVHCRPGGHVRAHRLLAPGSAGPPLSRSWTNGALRISPGQGALGLPPPPPDTL